MPLNGPRAASVALSSNRVCKGVPRPSDSAHASRMLPGSYYFMKYACLATYVIPYVSRTVLPTTTPKNIFGRAGTACQWEHHRARKPSMSTAANVANSSELRRL